MADLLIGPVPDKSIPFDPGPGSSGGLWIHDVNENGKTAHIPLALNWGRMDLHDGNGEYPLALATHVTNVLSLLGVDIETAYGTGTGTAPVWGGVRHVNIADVAWDILGKFDRNIGAFFRGKQTGGDRGTLQELAKVPDYWSQPFKGDGWYRASEGPNHYSNIDLKVGSDLLMNEKVTKAAWLAFYAKAGKTSKLGALPFRIARCTRACATASRRSNPAPDLITISSTALPAPCFITPEMPATRRISVDMALVGKDGRITIPYGITPNLTRQPRWQA